MAYAQHYRVTFGGTLAEGVNGAIDEVWACNVNVVPAGGGTMDEDAYLASVGPKLANWFGAGQNGMSSAATLNYIKCNRVGADGKYVDRTGSHRFDLPTPRVGGRTPVNPQIMTTCLSWVTVLQRGPGSHGRIYPPNNTLGDTTGELIPASDAIGQANAGVALLKILNNSSNAPSPNTGTGPVARPVIASGINGTNTDITGCRVGNVKDVQRRRKNALIEVYTAPSPFLAAGS